MNARRAAAARRREGASQSRAKLRDHYNSWLRHHRLSAADSLFRVLDNPLSSVLTWLVIGIALALPVGLDVALDNVNRLSTSWDSPTQISLFLLEEVDAEQATQLALELDARGDVADTVFISREEASSAPCPGLPMCWPAWMTTRCPTWSWYPHPAALTGREPLPCAKNCNSTRASPRRCWIWSGCSASTACWSSADA